MVLKDKDVIMRGITVISPGSNYEPPLEDRLHVMIKSLDT